MRSAIVKLPEQRSLGERRQVLRAAARQLDRAEIYLAAVAFMDLGDQAAVRAIAQLRADLDGLRRHLSEQRGRIHS
jgi:acyl-CoA reductase-like NAD-dependent aldehyde dehydrogenase